MFPIRLAIAATLASVAVAFSSFAQCVPSFTASTSAFAGTQPRALAVANVNGDAYPDLYVGASVASGPANGGLSVLTGRAGDVPRQSLALYDGQRVNDLIALDFDHDGDDDGVFVHDETTPMIRVVRNSAGVSFPETAAYAVPQGTRAGLEKGDFNGDHFDDFVFITSMSAVVYISNGDGTFAAKTFGTGFTIPPVAIDLDRDGKDELITGLRGSAASTIEIFSGDAATGLARVRTIAASRARDQIAAGDFDGDGALDLIALSGSLGPVDFIYSAATATEVTKKIFLDLFAYGRVVTGDIDKDGVDDLAVPAYGMIVALGQRDRTLQRMEVWIPGREGFGGPRDFALIDFDRDGDLDVAAAEREGVSFLENRNGKLRAARFGRYALATGDFNNDGRTDVFDGGEVARRPSRTSRPETSTATVSSTSSRRASATRLPSPCSSTTRPVTLVRRSSSATLASPLSQLVI